MSSYIGIAIVSALVLVTSACGSGTGGTALPPFDPFGTEAPGGGSEGGGSAQSIAQLCATDCARVAMCPSSNDSTCASGCSAEEMSYPNCTAQLQSFLVCVSTAGIACDANGDLSISGCTGEQSALFSCMQTTPTPTATAGASSAFKKSFNKP